MASTLPRIKLRIDTTKNWERSLTPLYEGEVAISYDLVESKLSPGTYDKRNFKIKIGKGNNVSNSCLWRYAADLEVAHISEEDLQRIVNEVKEQLGDVFVKQSEFRLAMSALESKIEQLWQKLANKVSATVSDAVLMLTIDN